MSHCPIDDCGRDTDTRKGGGRGMCPAHYQRFRRHGDPHHGGPLANRKPTGGPCTIQDCPKPSIAVDLCENHYRRFKRYGNPTAGRSPVGLDAIDRFRSMTEHDPPTGCVNWLGTVNSAGYGTFTANSERDLAHRWALRFAGIELIPGLQVDHLCFNRLCVNAAGHLEQVTGEENKRRARERASGS